MHCPSCGSENRQGRKFCAACGARLTLACSACGAKNQPGERFCGECGSHLDNATRGGAAPPRLDERTVAEKAALEARSGVEGERKMITALFADIHESTEIAEKLDPEDARAIVDPVLQIMIEAVRRHEGYVAQSLGDGILALFGAPIAQEDHARRAIHAALRMQDEMRCYAERLKRENGISLEIRVGLNTGEVVARSVRKDDLHADYVPVGHSVNLAARM